MTEIALLPQNIVRLSPRAGGIELYFPPLRTPEVALLLGLFGTVCMALPLLALAGVPAGGTHSLLAVALLGAFVAPFPVFGAIFVALAAYMLANSLTVSVNASAIRTVRRVFGFAFSRRELKCAEITEFKAQISAKYQELFGSAPYFRLVARHATLRRKDLVVAESLKGEAMMAQMQDLIARHAGLGAHSLQAGGQQDG